MQPPVQPQQARRMPGAQPKNLEMLPLILTLLFQNPPPPLAPSGSIIQTSLITATAGSIICTLAMANPASNTGVHIECKLDQKLVLVLDMPVPSGSSSLVGSYSNSGDTVSWVIGQPGGAISWTMTANGTSKSGSF
jgi:hypothetical protein